MVPHHAELLAGFMRRVVTDRNGTARSLRQASVAIAGKTGTAEEDQGGCRDDEPARRDLDGAPSRGDSHCYATRPWLVPASVNLIKTASPRGNLPMARGYWSCLAQCAIWTATSTPEKQVSAGSPVAANDESAGAISQEQRPRAVFVTAHSRRRRRSLSCVRYL